MIFIQVFEAEDATGVKKQAMFVTLREEGKPDIKASGEIEKGSVLDKEIKKIIKDINKQNVKKNLPEQGSSNSKGGKQTSSDNATEPVSV